MLPQLIDDFIVNDQDAVIPFCYYSHILKNDYFTRAVDQGQFVSPLVEALLVVGETIAAGKTGKFMEKAFKSVLRCYYAEAVFTITDDHFKFNFVDDAVTVGPRAQAFFRAQDSKASH